MRSLLAERIVCTKVRRTRECIRVIRVGERVEETGGARYGLECRAKEERVLLLRGKAARGGERVLSGCCIKGSLFKVGIYLFLAMLGCHCCRASLFLASGGCAPLWRAGLSHLSGAQVLGTRASVPAVRGSGAQAQ